MKILQKVIFNEEKCKGCELCTTVCPKKIVVMNKSKINSKGFHPATVTNQDECISCGFCAMMCPDVVIEVRRPLKEEKKDE